MKRFWRRLKSLSGRIKSSAIPDLQVSSAPGDPVHVVSTDSEKADILNEFFASQTHLVNCRSSVPDLPCQVPPESKFSNLYTTPSDVFDVLTHLKPGKAPGLDDIPLAYCLSALVVCLQVCLNYSIVLLSSVNSLRSESMP